MLPDDLEKHREIGFIALPPDQVARALAFLAALPELEAGASPHKCCLWVSYDIRTYTLQNIEDLLVAQGFHLDNSLYAKLKRALVHYSENVQRDNLRGQEAGVRARTVFAEVYQHHLHGDHDDTPDEWRRYH